MIEATQTFKRKERIYLYGPILFVEAYLCLTIVLYIFGPWDWPTQNKGLFYLFLFLYNIALFLGYLVSIKRKSGIKTFKKETDSINTQKVKIKVIKYLNIGIYFYLIFTILNCIRVTGIDSISPLAYLEKVINGINNPALQYRDKFVLASSRLFGGAILSYTNVLLSPLLYPVVPLSVYYFKELKFNKKALFIFTLLLECSRWVATGTNKGIFDIAVTIITVLLIKNAVRKFHGKTKRRAKFTKIKVLTVLILPIMFFITAISDRLGGNISQYSSVISNVQINFDSLLMKITPGFMQLGLILMTSYLTQGYYALSMAITLPFTPLFGIGNSMFLIENFKELTDVNLFQYTYQTKLEVTYGWGSLLNWHTFYVWVANDVSFYGVILVMFIIGYTFGAIWKDIIYTINPIAIVLMVLYSIMFIYMSSNNQVLSYPTTFMPFWILTLFWLNTRKINIKGT